MKEVWKDIEGYEGYYQVSNFGRVKSLDRISWNGSGYFLKKGIILKPFKMKTGYYAVKLSVRGIKNDKTIHRLIATHFINNLENKKTVNHKDGDKSNNSLSNLEWATYSENNKHARENGLNDDYGSNSVNSKLSEPEILIIRKYSKLGYTQKEISRWFGISQSLVSAIVNRKKWKHI